MHRRVLLLIFTFTFAFAALVSTVVPARAAGATCSSDPTAGPPGTLFKVTCTGFSPNIHVNAYVVEPDGRAVTASQVVGFHSNAGNSDILTDADGTASFSWASQDGRTELFGGGTFADQIGDWTWVVHELGPGQTVIAQGQAKMTLQAYHWTQSGAALSAQTTDNNLFTFLGTGFTRDEYVNLWVSLPANCSGRANVEGSSADDPLFQGLFDGFIGPNTVKADETGSISFSIFFYLACLSRRIQRNRLCAGQRKWRDYTNCGGRRGDCPNVGHHGGCRARFD